MKFQYVDFIVNKFLNVVVILMDISNAVVKALFFRNKNLLGMNITKFRKETKIYCLQVKYYLKLKNKEFDE